MKNNDFRSGDMKGRADGRTAGSHGKNRDEIWVTLEKMNLLLRKKPDPHWDSSQIRENLVYVTGDLLADPFGGIIYKEGKRLPIGRVERELFMTLLLNRTMFCSRERLVQMVNELYCHNICSNTLNKHINNLRIHLGDNEEHYIATQYRYGYKWEIPVYKYYLDRDCYVMQNE